MPSEPQIELLSYKRRVRFFWLLALIFIVSLPTLIFYTTGYRIEFTEEEAEIVTTGGIFVGTDLNDIEIYVDDRLMDGRQFLGTAQYIQNITVGQHRIVVQGDGLFTWVKDLPVFEYKVTDVSSFNLPQTPLVRLIAQYETPAGTPVVFATTSEVFAVATTTERYRVATSTATSSLVINPEYEFVESLFTSSTAPTSSVFTRYRPAVERFAFSSDVARATSAIPENATTSITDGNLKLFENGAEVFVQWMPESFENAPAYFCVDHYNASTTIARYGQHVMDNIIVEYGKPAADLAGRVCRRDIRIDRKWMDVFGFYFFPGRPELVIMHLNDGIYVVEVDDRAWQNTQVLYPGDYLRLVIDGGSIYIQDGDQFFEVLTELDE